MVFANGLKFGLMMRSGCSFAPFSLEPVGAVLVTERLDTSQLHNVSAACPLATVSAPAGARTS